MLLLLNVGEEILNYSPMGAGHESLENILRKMLAGLPNGQILQ